MATAAEKAIRRKSDREEKRRKRRGEVPEVSPEEEADMYLPDGSRNPKYYREESDQPIEPRDITRADRPEPLPEEFGFVEDVDTSADTLADIDKQRELDEFHGLRPKSPLDEFKDIAESGEFSDEEPQGTSEEEAAEEDAAEPMPPLGNQILPDTEAQALGDSFEFDEEQAEFDKGRDEFDAETERQVAEIDADRTPVSGGIIDRQVQKDALHVEKAKKQNEIVDRLGSGESRAEIAAADNPQLQAAIAAKADREAAKPSIHERDTATAAEMAARFEARGTKGGYQRSAVEPPMINSEGKELGSKYYDPKLSEVKNIVVDGVIVAREVVDLEGVREEENATQKKKGMIWMKPSKGGFKTGDQRFAGQGPGRWMNEEQAEAADTTNIERPIEEARRQAVLDKKNRTPQQIREDNIRQQQEHEIDVKQIEHGQDDDEKDIVKKEMEIKHLQMLLAQPGLTVAQRKMYQQQLNALLGGGPVGGGAGAVDAEAGEEAGGDAGMSATDANTELEGFYPDLHDTLTVMADPEGGAAFESTALHGDQADTGELYIKLRELYDSTSVTPENAAAVGAFIASKLKAFHRTEIARMQGGHIHPGESNNGWNIEGTSEHDLYLFFQAIMNGQMPPQPQGMGSPTPLVPVPPRFTNPLAS